MYFVYILECIDGSYYTGSTNDIVKRFKNHIDGKGGRYTRSHKPIKVIYKENFKTKSDALKREIQIKKFTKKEKLILINT
jgi:putative endonuclease